MVAVAWLWCLAGGDAGMQTRPPRFPCIHASSHSTPLTSQPPLRHSPPHPDAHVQLALAHTEHAHALAHAHVQHALVDAEAHVRHTLDVHARCSPSDAAWILSFPCHKFTKN